MKENRRKGFTLIELLAVIIVLALILVFAIPAVLNTSEKAQKKSFATYGRRVLTLAEEYIEAKKLDGAVGQMAIQNGVDGFSLGSNDAEYKVGIDYDGNGGYKIYMYNNTYYIGTVENVTTTSGATEAELKTTDNVHELNGGTLTLSIANVNEATTCTATYTPAR